MSTFVLDASAALSWCFEDEITAAGQGLLEQAGEFGVAVPALWLTEICNVLMINERRGRLSARQTAAFLAALAFIDVTIDPARPDIIFARVLPMARQEQITTYDASYLELAIRLQLPLASLDRKLREVASRRGVRLLDL